jgi:hypothetical protein
MLQVLRRSLAAHAASRGDAKARAVTMSYPEDSLEPAGTVKHYSPAALLLAKQAMLAELVEISGGELLRGCCTQDCCDSGGCPDGIVVEPPLVA